MDNIIKNQSEKVKELESRVERLESKVEILKEVLLETKPKTFKFYSEEETKEAKFRVEEAEGLQGAGFKDLPRGHGG